MYEVVQLSFQVVLASASTLTILGYTCLCQDSTFQAGRPWQ